MAITSPSHSIRTVPPSLLATVLASVLLSPLGLALPAAPASAAPAPTGASPGQAVGASGSPVRSVGASTVPSGWAHWQGQWFTAWIPNRKWQVVESRNGLHVSSPTGTAEMSFGYATGAPAPYTLAQIRNLSLSPQAGLTNARILKTYAVRPMAGGQSQSYLFTATRIRDRAFVKGVLQVLVLSDYGTGAYGMAAQAYLAPNAQWATWSPTLRIITDHFAFYGHEAG